MKISLTSPVAGTVDKPKLQYDKITKQAIGGAIKTIFVGEFEPDGEGMVLQPVVFAPGSTVLDEQGKAIADQYVAVLEQKAKIYVDACGQATAADYAALLDGGRSPGPQKPGAMSVSGLPAKAPIALSTEMSKALVALAVERTEVVRSYLIDDKGSDTARVSKSPVIFDLGDTESTRVQFSL